MWDQIKAYLDRFLSRFSNSETAVAGNIVISIGLSATGQLQKAYHLPSHPVPHGKSVKLKGAAANTGLIFVGFSEVQALDFNATDPLMPLEIGLYDVSNTDAIWVSGNFVTDVCYWTVEQNKRGS